MFATDGTREHLAADGIEVASVSDLTEVPPLVGGQVRTFHPAIYAGILARRDIPEQLEQLADHGLELLDLVVVNVKPFAPEVGRGHIGIDEAIEMIDVAGAALLGAARAQRRGRRRGLRPGALRASSSTRCATLGQVSAEHALPARRGRVQHGRRVLRRDRRLPQPDRRQHLPASGWRWSSRRSPTCRTARTRTSGRRSTARRRTARGTLADATQLQGVAADVQQPARPRRRLPDRGRLHRADGRHHQAHRPGRRRVERGAGRGLPAARWTRTPSRRSAASWASTASSTAPTAREIAGQLVRGGRSRPATRRRRAGSCARRRAWSCSPSRLARPRACATTASRTSTSSASAAACSSRRSTPSTSTAASSRS